MKKFQDRADNETQVMHTRKGTLSAKRGRQDKTSNTSKTGNIRHDRVDF